VLGWLDLTNAFGSIPHRVIQDAVTGMGAPRAAQVLLESMTTGSTTRVQTSSGYTDPIPLNAGLKQSCPASPIIFNFAMERIMRDIEQQSAGYALHAGIRR